MELYPSLASSDPLCFRSTIEQLNDWPYLHLDIEDGNFIPNLTFGIKTVKAVCNTAPNKKLDVHLMVRNPCEWLERLGQLPIKRVAAHIEALEYPLVFLNRAKQLGFEVGLALNIRTSIHDVQPFLQKVDYLLIMTSEPDANGELLYEPALCKAIAACRLNGDHVQIVADGGLDEKSLLRLRQVGCSGAVLGRLVFESKDPLRTLNLLNKSLI